MANFYLTFGVQYVHEEHPLGRVVNPNGYMVVEAPSETEARQQVAEVMGDRWSMIYSEEEFFSETYVMDDMRSVDFYPVGCTATIREGKLVPAT